MPVAVHPGHAGSIPAISHFFVVPPFLCFLRRMLMELHPRLEMRVQIPPVLENGAVVQPPEHECIVSSTSCRRRFSPALAGWQRMPRVLHGVAGSNPASRKAVAQLVEQMCLFPCRCPQARPAPIDPANAGGTTEQRGRGFDSRQPQGASSVAERAACSTSRCRRCMPDDRLPR